MATQLSLPPPPPLSPPHSSLLAPTAYSAFAIAKLPSQFSPRSPLSASISPSSSFIAASAWLAAEPASAISYDDITLPLPFPSVPSLPDVELGAVVDSLTGFVAENPLVVIAGVAVVGIPLVVSSLLSQAKPWASISAREAFKKLEAEDAQLLDIRSGNDIKIEGTPDLRTLRKRVFQIPFTPGEDQAYLKKLLSKFKDPSNTTLFILDQFDGNSISVAKFITANGFKSAFAIKGGAEGPNGWRRNELPWLLPRKGVTLDFSGFKDVIDSTFNENPNLVPATLGVAAAAGVSLVVFSEAETALQLLGSAALIQLFVKKFLFAKDRQKTIQELQTFLDTKIAPKELVDELKGLSLLPKYKEVAPADFTNGALATTESSQEAEVQSEAATISEQVEEKDIERITETVSDLSSLAASTDLPQSSTPLSPYTGYPGLKPPSSPTPSRP